MRNCSTSPGARDETDRRSPSPSHAETLVDGDDVTFEPPGRGRLGRGGDEMRSGGPRDLRPQVRNLLGDLRHVPPSVLITVRLSSDVVVRGDDEQRHSNR